MSSEGGFSKYGAYISLGLEIAVGITLPLLAGYWLDDYWSTEPWLLLTGILIGIVNVFMIIYRLYNRMEDGS